MIVAIIIKMQHNTNKQLFKLLLVMRMALTLRTKKNKIMNKKMLLVQVFRFNKLKKVVNAEKHIVLKNIVNAIKMVQHVEYFVNVKTV